MRYIVVVHNWHVHSKGFTTMELSSKTREEAEKAAQVICYRKNKPFSSAAYTLIEIADSEQINKLNKIPKWIRWLFNAV